MGYNLRYIGKKMIFLDFCFQKMQCLWKFGSLPIRKTLQGMIAILFIYSKSIIGMQNLTENKMELIL